MLKPLYNQNQKVNQSVEHSFIPLDIKPQRNKRKQSTRNVTKSK